VTTTTADATTTRAAERGIIMQAESMRAILAGTKSRLLRLVVAAVRHEETFGDSNLLRGDAQDVDDEMIDAAHQYAKALSPADRERLTKMRFRP
jgi:hypothetical protein